MKKPGKTDLLVEFGGKRETSDDLADYISSSPLAPDEAISDTSVRMWFTRGKISAKWEAAALERLGYITANFE